MKYFPKIFCFIWICTTSILAQAGMQQNKSQFVVVPREVILPVIAVQLGCPLQFENVVHLAGSKEVQLIAAVYAISEQNRLNDLQ